MQGKQKMLDSLSGLKADSVNDKLIAIEKFIIGELSEHLEWSHEDSKTPLQIKISIDYGNLSVCKRLQTKFK